MSTHGVYVIRLPEIRKHPQADSLGLVEIEGYTCIVRTGDFSAGDLAIYVEPDYILPGDEHPFSALWSYLPADERRIRVRKFRGIYSQGLLMKLGELKDRVSEGSEVMALLGITRYDPYETVTQDGERPSESLQHLSVYDMENFRGGTRTTGRKWKDLFQIGERVVVTEKINGRSTRYAFREGRLWVGGHQEWVRKPTDTESPSIYWDAVKDNPWIETWCRSNEDKILYGEVFRGGKKMHYGMPAGFAAFLVFDVYLGARKWMDSEVLFGSDFRADGLFRVPVVYDGPFDFEKMEALAEADSVLRTTGNFKPHYTEGVVIKPAVERVDPELGRVLLKLVGNRYLEKS